MNFSKRVTPTGKYCFSSNGALQNSFPETNKKPMAGSNSSAMAFGRTMQRPTGTRQHQSMAGMASNPTHENDFRCEFDLPKFVDLRQSMVTRSQKASILSMPDIRETLASSSTAVAAQSSIGFSEENCAAGQQTS